MKHLFWAFGCLIAVIVLFYAVEDWMGWHAWNKFRREWEAKGEHFDMASLAPPRVPDDENFALTPIVYTSYGQSLTKDGKEIPSDKRDDHFNRRMVMRTYGDDDGPTNASGNWIKGTFVNLESWQRYYRELAARTNIFPIPAQPRSPAEDVLLALNKYDGVIEELRAASRLKFSRFPLNYESEEPALILLPHLAPFKGCAQALQLRAVAELQSGQAGFALQDVRLSLQLLDEIRGEPLLISHLVRIAMLQISLEPIWEGLAYHQWSDAHLLALDAELSKLDFLEAWRLSMRGEVAFMCAEVSNARQHPGKVGGYLDAAGNWSHPDRFLAFLIPSGWFYQNQYRYARMMENYYLPLTDVNQKTFSVDLARRAATVLAADVKSGSLFHYLEQIGSLDVFEKVAPKFAHAQSSVDLARVAIALERYRLARGDYPQTLEPLAARYLPAIPHDVIGGSPLHYRRTDDGRFVLYSVGWNGTDEGGIAVFTSGGGPGLESGDWVWQYPAMGEKAETLRKTLKN